MSKLIESLPLVNACLNASCFVLLVSGFVAIRKGKRRLHPRLMIGATVLSLLFLTSYLIYHAHAGSHPFPKSYPNWRFVYLYLILLPHTLLAAVNTPLVVITLIHAFRQKLEKHRRIARITLACWLYVSLTGVLIYLMLYHWFA